MDAEVQARRTFLKQVGKASTVVPAAALLISAASRPSEVAAGVQYGSPACGSAACIVGGDEGDAG